MTKDFAPDLPLRVMLATFHGLVGLIFSAFIIRYLLARPHLDFATFLAVSSFVLAWGIVARRPWVIPLQAILFGQFLAVCILCVAVLWYGPSLSEPQNLNASMMAWAVGPLNFYLIAATIGFAEIGSLVLLVMAYRLKKRRSLDLRNPQFHPDTKPAETADPKPRARYLAAWEMAAVIPLVVIIIVGDVGVPIVSNAMLRSFRERQAEVALNERMIAPDEASYEGSLLEQIKKINREIKSLGVAKRKLESNKVTGLTDESYTAIRVQRIAKIDEKVENLRAEKGACEKRLATVKKQRETRLRQNDKYISTGRK